MASRNVSNSVFILQLTSLPGTNTATISFGERFPLYVTSPPQPVVNFTCDRMVDEATGLINAHLQWSYVHENISYIQEAIKNYRIGFELITLFESDTMTLTAGISDLNKILSTQVPIYV